MASPGPDSHTGRGLAPRTGSESHRAGYDARGKQKEEEWCWDEEWGHTWKCLVWPGVADTDTFLLPMMVLMVELLPTLG